jgi:uncharacterized protein
MKKTITLVLIIAATVLACTPPGNIKVNDGQALIKAVYRGDTNAVEHMVAKGADVNVKDKDGITALMWASTLGHTETAKFLIAKGADVNARTPNGDTALIFAATSRYIDTVKILIDHGADVNAADKTGRTALMMAGRQEDIVDLLKKSGAKTHVPGTLNLFGKDRD